MPVASVGRGYLGNAAGLTGALGTRRTYRTDPTSAAETAAPAGSLNVILTLTTRMAPEASNSSGQLHG